MNNIFNNLKVYAGKWSIKETRNLTDEEKALFSQAVVVPSQYSNSVQFTLKNGSGVVYMPLDQDSELGTGELVDLNLAKVVTLCKQGEADIYRLLA